MKFSFAIVCSDDHNIDKCLKSIKENIPIIVVLNFPDDYVKNVCESDKRVKIIRHDERNLGKLRQMAANSCITPGICYIDSDCIIGRGFVNIVEEELDFFCAINIPMRYRYNNRRTKIVSVCRQFTTPEGRLLMPFAFRLEVQATIGKLFNVELSWGEDSDQKYRLEEKGIEYHVSSAIIYHKALTIKEDVKSAIRLGHGTLTQEEVLRVPRRSLLKDMSIIHEITAAKKCYALTGSVLATLYHFFVWRPAYKFGYWRARRLRK